ncbi:MAG: restriction endonuclease [Mailhella sp.]|nr:restriction endonuclease [Mailhella sp.]
MSSKLKSATIPQTSQLFLPTFLALKRLGGSGSNDEIVNQVIKDLRLTDEIADHPHLGSITQTELQYRVAWTKTYLKKSGIIENSARSVWSITPEYSERDTLTDAEIEAAKKGILASLATASKVENEKVPSAKPSFDYPEEIKPWRERLSDILQSMDPYGFERLTQRLLRECGFVQVEVTKKSGDGGIDGTGKLKINGIFSFNVAFQCKRYSGSVGASEIRDFRGSLTTSIEKGILITTGTFTKQAKEEASSPGKQQIDLIDGEEFTNKIAEFGIGVREVKTYEIDEEFFQKI